MRLVDRLLMCDVLCANAYVAFLVICSSVWQITSLAFLPLVFMFVAAQCKRMGWYHVYVVFHSVWHLGSALAIYRAFTAHDEPVMR